MYSSYTKIERKQARSDLQNTKKFRLICKTPLILITEGIHGLERTWYKSTDPERYQRSFLDVFRVVTLLAEELGTPFVFDPSIDSEMKKAVLFASLHFPEEKVLFLAKKEGKRFFSKVEQILKQ